jgi:hypothetical protein
MSKGEVVSGDGFEVFHNELLKASKEFANQGTKYEGLMPASGPACPSGGDGTIDKMLGVTLQAFGEMHVVLAQVIGSHGRKLGWVHDRYQNAENNTLRILQDLVTSPVPPTF